MLRVVTTYRGRLLHPLLALWIGTSIAFWQTPNLDFTHYDDPTHIHSNPFLVPPTLANISHAWTSSYHLIYIPVTFTAWGLMMKVAKKDGPWTDVAPEREPVLDPMIFHVANLLVHLANVSLVFLLCLTFVSNVGASLLGAFVFAVHPIQAEPVAWVSGLRDVLGMIFALTSLLAFIEYSEVVGAEKKSRWYFVALACFLLALLSKPTTVVFAPIAGLLVFARQPTKGKETLSALAPFLILSVIFSVIAAQVQSGVNVITFPVPDWWQRPFVYLDAIGFYLWKIAVPTHFCIDYTHTPTRALGSPSIFFYATLPALLAWFAFRAYRDRQLRLPLALLLCFGASFLPVSGLRPFAHQFLSTVADRYAYSGMAIVAVFCAWVLNRYRERAELRGGFAVGLVLLGIHTMVQVGYWHDTRSLFEHSLALQPHSWHSHYMLGSRDIAEGKFESAIDHLRKSIEVERNEQALTRLADIFIRRKQYDEAQKVLEETLSMRPYATEAYENLALVWRLKGDKAKARELYERALQVDPHSFPAYRSLRELTAEMEGKKATPQ